jgi:hypothetical protein
MTPSFAVRTTPRFDRLLRSLARRHAELPATYADALAILRTDTHTTGIVSIASENWKVSDREKANTGLPLAGGVFGMISTVERSCSTTAACAVKTPTADRPRTVQKLSPQGPI